MAVCVCVCVCVRARACVCVCSSHTLNTILLLSVNLSVRPQSLSVPLSTLSSLSLSYHLSLTPSLFKTFSDRTRRLMYARSHETDPVK